MKILISFLFISFFITNNAVAAFEDVRPLKNPGCNEKKLVDTSETILEAISIFTGKVNWEPVCARHDICYATIGADQNNCDNTFYDHLKGECRNSYPKNYKVILTGGFSLAARELCYDVANVMYSSVKHFGGPYFSEAKSQTKILLSNYPSRIYPKTNYVPFLGEYPFMMKWYAQGIYDELHAKFGRPPSNLEMYQEFEFKMYGRRTTPFSFSAIVPLLMGL